MENTELQLEIAELKHANEISCLVNSAYRGESSRLGWTTECDLLGGQRTDPQAIAELIESHDSVVLLLKKRASEGVEKIQACVNLVNTYPDAYLGMLTVDPVLQASGLGRVLLGAAEVFVKTQWQSRAITMTVITLRSELIAWYERRGYGRTGKFEKFPYGNVRFGEPKREDLLFEILRKVL